MKKFFAIFVLLFVSVFFTACGHSFYLGMMINTPKIGLLGLGTMTTVSVFNPTPYTAELYGAYGKYVGTIPPNGSAVGEVNVKFDGEQYPLLAWMLRNGERVGVAFVSPSLQPNQPYDWVIQEVRYPDGRYSYYNYNQISPYPPSPTQGVVKVDFPTIVLMSTTQVQFINCTYYTMQGGLIGGQQMSNVPPMSSVTLPYENINRIYGSVPVDLQFNSYGLTFGWAHRDFSISTDIPRVVQFIFQPSDIQTARQ